MHIGDTYVVRGYEHTIGHKTYLNMLSAKLIVPPRIAFRRRVGLVASLASASLIVGVVVFSIAGNHAKQWNNQINTERSPSQDAQDDITTNGSSKGIRNLINNPKKPPSPNKPTPTSGNSPPDSINQFRPNSNASSPQPTPTPSPAAPPNPPSSDPVPAPTPVPTPTPDPTPPPLVDPTPPAPPSPEASTEPPPEGSE